MVSEENLFKELNALAPDTFEVLARETDDGSAVEVVQYDNYRLLRWGGPSVQSVMDLRDPARVVSPVAAMMLLAWVASPGPRVMNLGVGGGTFERFLLSHDPSLELTSIENSHVMIELAQRYFFLDAASVRCESATDFLAQTPATFDLILCDLFTAEAPSSCLRSPRFFSDLADALDDEGTVAFNLLARDSQQLLMTLHQIRQYLPWTRLATVGDHDNVIALARHRPAPGNEELVRAADEFLREANVAPLPFPLKLIEVPDRPD